MSRPQRYSQRCGRCRRSGERCECPAPPYAEIEKLCRPDPTDRELAAKLKVSLRTIERWRANDPDFRDAEENGRAITLYTTRSRLYEIAGDNEHPKQITALIFLAKARLGMSDRVKLDVPPMQLEHTHTVEIPDHSRYWAEVLSVLRETGLIDRYARGNGADPDAEETLQ